MNHVPGDIGVLFVNGRAVLRPESTAVAAIAAAIDTHSEADFVQGDALIAAWRPNAGRVNLETDTLDRDALGSSREVEISGVQMVSRLWHLIDGIGTNIADAFHDAAHGYNVLQRPGADVHESAVMISGEHIFIEKGAVVAPGVVLDATGGPILIAEGARVDERSVLKGPVAVGRGSNVKIGANIRNAAFGPRCKVGGEVHDAIMHSFSNKAHDGFLGHAYVGSWCNLGAATNNSNLKNDYGSIRLFNEALNAEEDTERQFVGLFMADHAKCSIGTTFNTGTIVGVACNLFGAGFHPVTSRRSAGAAPTSTRRIASKKPPT